VEHPGDGDRLVVAVALEVDRGEAEDQAEGDDPGQDQQLSRR
jgi:hypothetical protein